MLSLPVCPEHFLTEAMLIALVIGFLKKKKKAKTSPPPAAESSGTQSIAQTAAAVVVAAEEKASVIAEKVLSAPETMPAAVVASAAVGVASA